MWVYEKKLEYPVKIKKPDPRMAKVILTQYGGPDGELAASIRYLSQRFSMVTPEAKATLNDIGTEEYVPIGYRSSFSLGILGYNLISNCSGDCQRAAESFKYITFSKTSFSILFFAAAVGSSL